MDVSRHLKLIAVSLAFSLAMGCAPASDSPVAPAPVLSGLPPPKNLIPYPTATRSVSLSATVSATGIPLPTPTPSTYTVAAGDSLGTIAEQFGLPLADLQAANPGVVSENLSIGQTLKIPAESPGAAGSSLPTPAPAQVGAVNCYPFGTGAYCLAAVHNPFPDALENVKLQFTLVNANGQPLPDGHDVASLEAFLPLDILPPESALPAYAYFPTLALGLQPSAQLSASIRLAPGDERYLPAVARNTLVSVDWDDRSARVQGQVVLLADAKAAAGMLRVVAVAYDADGRIVGFRRWEWQGRLKPGDGQPFDFFIYSLRSAIEKVEVIVEARP